MNGVIPNPTCPHCESLAQELADLREQIEQQQATIQCLQKKLEKKSRAAKRQAAPFRSSKKKPKEEHKKPGRKAQHPPAHRPRPDHVDHTIDVPVGSCPDCQVPLADVTMHTQFQTDIPPVQPIVTQFNVQVGHCPAAANAFKASIPNRLRKLWGAANHTLGPRAIATAADSKYRLGLPFRKIADFYQKNI